MTNTYESLGLKCGLEIHQQLNTNKLFCNCPSIIKDDKPDYTAIRYLRASAGETGTIDEAARAEQQKQKKYFYQGYKENTCLVEFDEEPPHELNQEALTVTLQVCKLLGASIVDQVRIMRKIVVDGSNTSGFQRTALIGIGGSIKGVSIQTICLEEDAAKIVERTPTHDTYNLSRLGIPLIEIATGADITTPQQAQDIAAEIGMILRSTGKVKRGIGTIRQDINVSIKEGVRVEIKGVQDLRLIPTIIEREVERQQRLIQLFKELKQRGATAQETIIDVTDIFTQTQAKIIRSALNQKEGAVLAIKLPGYKGYLGKELQPGRRLGTEFSDYAKTQGVKGLFHSDELPRYGITQEEITRLQTKLRLQPEDAFIIIADKKPIATRALQTVIKRAQQLTLIQEVRNAQPDGTSSYLRPMPGASRMYPETDVPPVTIEDVNIPLPELIKDKEQRYAKQYNISQDLARQLARQGHPFDDYVKKYPHVSPTLIAEVFITMPKELSRRYDIKEFPSYEEAAHEVLTQLNNKRIPTSSVIEILAKKGKGETVNYDDYSTASPEDIDKAITEELKKDPEAPIGALMGAVMKKLRGRADGKIVMQRLRERINK